MIISYNWLQGFFSRKLPPPEKLAELLNFHAFEVEKMASRGNDAVLDIKVLADRACYALSHRGVAYEIAAAADFGFKNEPPPAPPEVAVRELSIRIARPSLASRYIGRVVENVSVGASPKWLKEKLEGIGERSVNNIVDAANFVLFDIGQPLHAFDADKVKGPIAVRPAKKGERLTTLDGREIILDGAVLVIADEIGPLAIAGVKGGNRAEIGGATKNIILESANFNQTAVRSVSTRFDLRTSAARRFESGLPASLAEEAMKKVSAMIAELSPGARFGRPVDVYKKKDKKRTILISAGLVSAVLGITIKEEGLAWILTKLRILSKKAGGKLKLEIPDFRLDLNLPEDIAEEVGRLFGYEKIRELTPPPLRYPPIPHKEFYYVEKIKNLLVSAGYSEVSLYSLAERGVREIAKPPAGDRRFLRDNLLSGLKKAVELNLRNAPLIGLTEVKIFEIGRIFTPVGERLSLAVGVGVVGKASGRRGEELLSPILNLISGILGGSLSVKIVSTGEGAMFELDLTDLIPKLRSPADYNDLNFEKSPAVKFKMFSVYPFALRDLAIFVPKEIPERAVGEVIKQEAGSLLQRLERFDVFEKKFPDGSVKISYAFHLVLQSFEKTLTDDELNPVIERITKVLNGNPGWQVR
jgi:phenylalanyl-tRNA synthetase beta chain